MDEILLKKDSVHLTKQIEVMGATEPYEKEMSYDELNENYELQLDLENIEPESDENGEFSVRLRSKTEPKRDSMEEFEDLPPVPDVSLEEIKDNRRPFFGRIQNPERQPFDTRRIIYESGELTERKLKEMLHEQGYEGVEPGKQNGSVATTLVVLDEVTNEIERHGRGEDKTIKWVGAE
jgi:hypothetical protein